MSQVNAEARDKQKLQAIIEARRLCKYTLHILQNNDNFKVRPTGDLEDDEKRPPQPELVTKMRDTMLDIYILAYSANDTPFTKGNYATRRRMQDKSIARCREMLALIELAKDAFHTPSKRVEYWTGKAVLVRNLLQKWKEGDYHRYKRM